MIVYKTTNLINGKIYVGQTSIDDPKYMGSGWLISKAIKKYGVENFKRETLCTCTTKEELNEQEINWIKLLDSTNKTIGYNISPGGTGGKLVENEWKKGKTYEEAYGAEKAKELKELFSIQRKGKEKQYVNFTKEEVAKKLSHALMGNVHDSENRKKISDSLKKYHSDNPDRKEQISQTLKEYYKTPNGILARKMISERKSGVKQSEESNRKRSIAMRGRGPKLEVHGSARYWYFYDRDNKLIHECLGSVVKAAEMLGTYHAALIKFESLEECLKFELPKNKKFKVYHKRYYDKQL